MQSWTQSLGWFPTIPSTVEEAVAQNWRKINKVCDDIKQIPGFRYENLNDPSKFGLVLIFDYHDYLTGNVGEIKTHFLKIWIFIFDRN